MLTRLGEDFTAKMILLRLVQQAPEIGNGSQEMAIGKVIFLAADMCGSLRPRAGGMLQGSKATRITRSESLRKVPGTFRKGTLQ